MDRKRAYFMVGFFVACLVYADVQAAKQEGFNPNLDGSGSFLPAPESVDSVPKAVDKPAQLPEAPPAVAPPVERKPRVLKKTVRSVIPLRRTSSPEDGQGGEPPPDTVHNIPVHQGCNCPNPDCSNKASQVQEDSVTSRVRPRTRVNSRVTGALSSEFEQPVGRVINGWYYEYDRPTNTWLPRVQMPATASPPVRQTSAPVMYTIGPPLASQTIGPVIEYASSPMPVFTAPMSYGGGYAVGGASGCVGGSCGGGSTGRVGGLFRR